MNVTSKSRYALQIMLDLAKSEKGSLRKRSQLAEEHKISQNYMNKIIFKLKNKNLIECCRGSCGGLRLIKPANQITLWQIISAVENRTAPVNCVDDINSCSIAQKCISKDAWLSIFSDIKSSLSSKKLADFI
jgi:Rrf2 family transcriptional regulator, iron-sulfur cluster assembly transcription factor